MGGSNFFLWTLKYLIKLKEFLEVSTKNARSSGFQEKKNWLGEPRTEKREQVCTYFSAYLLI